MACALTKSVGLLDCDDDLTGGVDEIYIANKADIVSITDASGNTGVVSAIEMDEGTQFYRYYGRKGSVVYNDNYAKSDTGAKLWTPQLVFDLSGLKAEIVAELIVLTKAETVALVKTRAGEWLLIGSLSGLEVQSIVATSGTAGTDFSGYQAITLGSEVERRPARHVDSSIVPALLIPAA